MQDQVKKSLKVVNFVGIGAVTLLLAGTLAFGIVPMYKEGKGDIEATIRRREALERVETLRPDVKDAQQAKQESEDRLKAAEARMPKGQPDNEFSKELNEVAKASGIRVESTPPPGKPQADGAFFSVLVSVEGSGDWESCMRFLKGISSMNRVSRLDSVVLDTERESGNQVSTKPLCHILVKFTTYYLEQ